MNCEQAREAMADALAGRPEAALHEHLAGCEACRDEFGLIQAPWRRMEAWHDVEPPPQVRVRFHEMLDAYQHGIGARQSRSFWSWWPSKPVLQFGIAVACLLAGFFGGRAITETPQSSSQSSSDLAELKKEMAGMRQLVTLSLLQQQSATDRLRGVNWAYQMESSDTEVLGALLRTINTDPNVNVRLAAIDAVHNFASSPVARRGLVQALPRQTSPLAQIALVDTLVELKQSDARPEIEVLLGEPNLDPTVRERLQAAVRKLE